MAMQLLTHSKKKANGKTYTYYSIAEPYWEDKKNKKKILFYLGSLTPSQAQQAFDMGFLEKRDDLRTSIQSFPEISFI